MWFEPVKSQSTPLLPDKWEALITRTGMILFVFSSEEPLGFLGSCRWKMFLVPCPLVDPVDLKGTPLRFTGIFHSTDNIRDCEVGTGLDCIR